MILTRLPGHHGSATRWGRHANLPRVVHRASGFHRKNNRGMELPICVCLSGVCRTSNACELLRRMGWSQLLMVMRVLLVLLVLLTRLLLQRLWEALRLVVLLLLKQHRRPRRWW